MRNTNLKNKECSNSHSTTQCSSSVYEELMKGIALTVQELKTLSLTLYGLSRIGRWEEKGKLIRTEHEKGPILACKIHQINVTHTRAFRFIILLHLINQQSLEFLCMYTFYRKYLNYVGVLL